MRLHALRDTLRADLDIHTERGRLIRSAGATAAIKAGATVIAFGASLLYARVLGPHGYGLYVYVLAWVAVLTVPTTLGLPQYLIREGAKYPHSLHWLCHWADKKILLAGVAVAALMACAVFLPQAAGARWLFVIAAPLPLLNSMTSLRGALLQAGGWIARSQWPILLLSPIIALAALAVLWVLQGSLYPVELIAIVTGTAILPLIANELQLRIAVPGPAHERTPVRAHAALPFMWISMLYLVSNRTDLIMLGAIKGAHDAGIYAIAARAAELVTFFLTAATMVVTPRIARLFRKGDLTLLQRLLTGASRRIFLLTLPIALLFIVAARPLIIYVYGIDYVQGAFSLQILAGAQLINVAAGPTSAILSMTGYEKLSALGVGLSVILNITLNAILIPIYGTKGAAISTSLSLIFWNILLWYWIRLRLGLRPTGIGL